MQTIESLDAEFRALEQRRRDVNAELALLTNDDQGHYRSDLSTDEQTRAEALKTERTDLTAKARENRDLRSRHSAIQDGFDRGNYVQGDNPQTSSAYQGSIDPWAERSGHTTRDRALAALDNIGDEITERAHAQIERQLRNPSLPGSDGHEVVIAGSDPAYRSAFAKLMRDPVRGHMEFSDSERLAYSRAQSVARSINVATGANGGFMMPLTLDPQIMLTSSGVEDPLREISRVVTTTTDHWKGITSAGVTAGYAAEGSEVGDDSPSDLAQPTVNIERGDCNVEVTLEAAQDLDFVNQLGELFADAKANVEAAKFWAGAGTGSNEPEGVVTGLDGTSSEVAPTTPETFAVADVYKLLEALPARFRRNATWVGNLAILNDIRQFGTADSHALWAHLNDGTPGLLLGKPVREASESDDGFNPAATADNFILTVGDFRAGFVIADRLGSMVTITPSLGSNRRPKGANLYTLWFRNGSKVVNPAALRMLSIPTTA